ncbi:hypothetical protein [Streptomyces sp. NPDC096153]|uniref:hypothetical protein n=1 Tax=Streptomyces sp. NPDC096153 TaxID=3155548 RepID=UPI0033309DF0
MGGSVQDACAPETDDRPAAAPQLPRLVPPPPGGRRTDRGQAKSSSSGAGQQPPLLFPVRTPPHVTEDQAQLRASATADDIRRAIAQHGQREAVRLYGFRLVAPHFPDTDGTGGTRAQ